VGYYEDYKLGDKFTTGARSITDSDASSLTATAGFTDKVFWNEAYARTTALGWRAVPGRVVFALSGGLVETSKVFSRTPGEIVNAGADKLSWKVPLKVGDTIHVDIEIINLRESKNPKWGVITCKEKLVNQKGETVMESELIRLFERKANKTA
jgi:acyl dehydratase